MTAKETRRADFGEVRGEQLQAFELSRRGASPEPCSVYDITAEAERIRTLNAAKSWRRRNPRVWADWERQALAEAAAGRRFSVRYLAERTRKHDTVDDCGEPFEVNNSHCSIFARMLVSEHAELKPFVELRRSIWDDTYPEARGGVARG